MDELFDLRGRVALVTGGTSGIGLMIARALVRRGVLTCITGRDVEQVRAIAGQLSAQGRCEGIAADLADADGPHRLAAAFAALHPRLDILVNNAGANEKGRIDTATVADWDHVMNVNLRAAFFLVQQILPCLKAGAAVHHPARVINIGSIGGLHIPAWEAYPYGASKAAVHHLTRALAKRLGHEGITVNAIAPGPFPSRLTDTDSDAVKKSVQTFIPLGRAGEAADLEGAVVFLASRAGAYVNGTTLPLDGGYIGAL